MAQRQIESLSAAGASFYTPQEFHTYLDELAAARLLYDQEQTRFPMLRDYRRATAAFKAGLLKGAFLARQLQDMKRVESAEISSRREILANRLSLLRNLSLSLPDRRLAQASLMKADLMINQVLPYLEKGQNDEALNILAGAEQLIKEAITHVNAVVGRFADEKQIKAWRRMADKAIDESRKTGTDLLVISKIERHLTHYKRGKVVRRYDAGLGMKFLNDKLYSGDKATPEGSYRVIRKVPDSKYFLALLIDYPNEDDRRRFAEARRRGQIPDKAGIGGLIEIHGGSRNSLTDGCIALDNQNMEQLYKEIEPGTPVIIVGTTLYDNIIATTLAALQ